jgi:asparaginyl-tRNA synthetase
LTRVYTFGPTFRTENSNTSRHLAEFWMIEPEIAFADLPDNAALAKALLKYTFAALLNEREEDLAFFDQRIEKGLVAKLEGIVGSEFVPMDYGEAIQVLERANEKFEFPVKWGVDLQSEHERYLTEKYAKKPVIVMDYPKDIKAFYMRVNDDGRTVAAMDVLAPGSGEIIGGSQREERLEVMDQNMAERGIDREHYAWYRDLPATERCRRPLPNPPGGGRVGTSGSSAPSPTSPASPMCVTPSPSRARRGTQGTDFVLLQAVAHRWVPMMTRLLRLSSRER